MGKGFRVACLSMFAASGVALAGDWVADLNSQCKVWNPNPRAGEKVAWSGSCVGGFAEGRGILQWFDRDSPHERDEGNWLGGRQTGQGTQTWPSGRYEGSLKNGMPDGSGVLVIGKARYDGQFRGGKPEGMGTLTNSAGTFTGLWSGGCYNSGDRRVAVGRDLASCR